jgi:NADH-quinone oxidoreductase subunit J
MLCLFPLHTCVLAAASGPLEAALSPVVILVLCVAAGVGTVLLLPGRETTWTRIGGVLLLSALVVLAALVVRYSSTVGGWNGMGAYFWIFSSVAVLSALRVVTHSRPVYSALYFVLTVLASAGLFVLLWAEFMAAALVVIYAGAILVTYVFVIMLAQQSQSTSDTKPLVGLADYDLHSRDPMAAAAIGFALMGVFLFVIFDKAQAMGPQKRAYTVVADKAVPGAGAVEVSQEVYAATPQAAADLVGAQGLSVVGEPSPAASSQALGRYLFDHQLVSLELAGLILTLSMVGAIVIARRRVDAADAFEPTVETLRGPATPVDDNPHSIPVFGTDNPRAKAYPER